MNYQTISNPQSILSKQNREIDQIDHETDGIGCDVHESSLESGQNLNETGGFQMQINLLQMVRSILSTTDLLIQFDQEWFWNLFDRVDNDIKQRYQNHIGICPELTDSLNNIENRPAQQQEQQKRLSEVMYDMFNWYKSDMRKNERRKFSLIINSLSSQFQSTYHPEEYSKNTKPQRIKEANIKNSPKSPKVIYLINYLKQILDKAGLKERFFGNQLQVIFHALDDKEASKWLSFIKKDSNIYSITERCIDYHHSNKAYSRLAMLFEHLMDDSSIYLSINNSAKLRKIMIELRNCSRSSNKVKNSKRNPLYYTKGVKNAKKIQRIGCSAHTHADHNGTIKNLCG
jgi:hypothetical protein